MKSYGLVLIIGSIAYFVSVNIAYEGGSFRFLLLVLFIGADIISVAGLVGQGLYRVRDISFRFPRLYISILGYLASVLVLVLWYNFSNNDILLYTGIGLACLGTVILPEAVGRNPILLGPEDTSFLESKHPRDEIPTFVDSRWYNPGLQGLHYVRFERGLCFLVMPGKRLTWVKPKQVLRVDSLTLKMDTGRWPYGALTLKFALAQDADMAEEGLRRVRTTLGEV